MTRTTHRRKLTTMLTIRQRMYQKDRRVLARVRRANRAGELYREPSWYTGTRASFERLTAAGKIKYHSRRNQWIGGYVAIGYRPLRSLK